MNFLGTLTTSNLPGDEAAARSRLTVLWFVMLAINIAIVLFFYPLGAFGPVREATTMTALLKALDAIFFVFSSSVLATFTYWFALKQDKTTPLRNSMAFRISWFASMLFGFMITVIHLLGGAAAYDNGLQTLAMHSNWLVTGSMSYYFAGAKKASAPRPGPKGRKQAFPQVPDKQSPADLANPQ
jgi:hypothetical protein